MWPAVCRTRCDAPSAKERHPAGCLSSFVNARAPAHRKERNVCKGNLCRVSGYGWPRQVVRHKRFAAGKPLAQAEFISAEHVKYPWGGAARGRECMHSRTPQGKECVQGKPLPGFWIWMAAPSGASQAFCRRQNLGAGGIHFRRVCQIPLGWSGHGPRNTKIKDRQRRSFIFGASDGT